MPILEDKQKAFAGDAARWRIAATVALISGVFLLTVAVLLIANYIQIQAIAPLDNPELLALRKQLNTSVEADPKLVQTVRAMDLMARKAFFTSQAQLRMGGQLLLLGAVVFLVSFKLAARWRPVLPKVGETAGDYWELVAQAKSYIITGGMVITVLALFAAYLAPSQVPVSTQTVEAKAEGEAAGPSAPTPAATAKAEGESAASAPVQTAAVKPESVAPAAPAASGEPAPTWDEMLAQWPSFRGPGDFGVAHFTTAPTQWDMASGQGVKWKADIALPGNNSPVVWGNRVFLCGATADTREVYCFDTEDGKLVWKNTLEKFPGTPDPGPKIESETSYAPPTMAALGKRVFAIFPNGDVVCFDHEGKQQWGKNIGMPDNHYGHASSLLAFGKWLYIQMDDRTNPRLMALDTATGNETWSVKRTKISWSSPALVPAPSGPQLVLCSERDVDAYNPETGAPLWSVKCLDGEVAPSPAYVDGTVFVANEYAKATLIQITPDGAGFKGENKWQYEDMLPEVSSPLATAGQCYIATARGEVVCIDRKTGQQVWMHEYEEGFSASMVLVGGNIYLPDKKGVMHIFKDAPQFEAVGDIDMGEPIHATPAYLDNRMYIRTEKQLVCVEKK